MPKTVYDLRAFQRAADLAERVYEVTADFPRQELYGLISQLRRAATSVVSQIAEGHGRLSFGEWRQFLSQARGSLFEVEAQIIIAERLHFVTKSERVELLAHIASTARALTGLIRWVREKEAARERRAL